MKKFVFTIPDEKINTGSLIGSDNWGKTREAHFIYLKVGDIIKKRIKDRLLSRLYIYEFE